MRAFTVERLDAVELKYRKVLEDENAKLKKVLAERVSDTIALRELRSKRIVGPILNWPR